MALPLGLLAIPSIFQGATGLWEMLQSSKYAKAERPDYEIPQSITDMLNNAKMVAAQTQLPGQSLAEEKLSASTARGITAAKELTDSPTSALGSVASLVGQEQDKLRDLNIAASEAWQTNQGTLRTALQNMGIEEGKKWTWDKQMPYQASMETASALQKSGLENIFSALKQGATGTITASANKDYLKTMQDYYDNQNALAKASLDKMTGSNRNVTPTIQGNAEQLEQLTSLWNQTKGQNPFGTSLYGSQNNLGDIYPSLFNTNKSLFSNPFKI